MSRSLLAGLLLAASVLASCDDSGEETPSPAPAPRPGEPGYVRDAALDTTNISRHNEQRSHNMGQNCMGCHQSFGPGKGRFTVAGTAFNLDGTVHPNATLRLYDGPATKGGALVLEVQADALGNFFSTESLPFPDAPLFPVVESADGVHTNAMPFPTISGACNVCHVGNNLIRPDHGGDH